MRPPMLGGVPKGTIVKVVCFPENGLTYEKMYVDVIHRYAWGYIEYSEPLTDEQVEDYELQDDPRNGTTFW